MRKQAVSITLTAEDKARVDAQAAKDGTNRSQVIREMIRCRRRPVELKAAERAGAALGRTLYKLKRR